MRRRRRISQTVAEAPSGGAPAENVSRLFDACLAACRRAPFDRKFTGGATAETSRHFTSYPPDRQPRQASAILRFIATSASLARLNSGERIHRHNVSASDKRASDNIARLGSQLPLLPIAFSAPHRSAKREEIDILPVIDRLRFSLSVTESHRATHLSAARFRVRSCSAHNTCRNIQNHEQ